jgi:hypothetical protein
VKGLLLSELLWCGVERHPDLLLLVPQHNVRQFSYGSLHAVFAAVAAYCVEMQVMHTSMQCFWR